ncbi:flagellar hook-basal body complex protein FliE [Vibrio parahaemolyticus]|nr:flagellar hook-basal body complex protein FliE [Vibrio parahaemolyticus]
MSIENTQMAVSQAAMLNKMDAHRNKVTGIHPNGLNQGSLQFGSVLRTTLDKVNAQQVDAANKVRDYELGLSDDLIGTTVASQKASLSFSALMQVRNKLVSGYDELIKMPL